jgi:hypothetical protein
MIVDERECHKFQCPILTSSEVYRECIGGQCMFWVWAFGSTYGTHPHVPVSEEERLLGFCGEVHPAQANQFDLQRAVKFHPPEER